MNFQPEGTSGVKNIIAGANLAFQDKMGSAEGWVTLLVCGLLLGAFVFVSALYSNPKKRTR